MQKTGRGRPHTIWTPATARARDQKVHYARTKAQAVFRSEPWDLSFENWLAAWGSLWDHRGKSKHEYCMIRIDRNLPWTQENVQVLTRYDFLIQKNINKNFVHRGKKILGE
jgi:hypothetical protein